jgi:diguanylate cyclase (GGDEF)-like protein
VATDRYREVGTRQAEGLAEGDALLLSAIQCEVLRAIASGAKLPEVAMLLCRRFEAVVDDAACSLLAVDAGACLRTLAAPSLPPDFCDFVNGAPIGPMVGSCGSAAFLRHPVHVRDIDADPRWAPFKTLPVAAGFRACWSSPVIGAEGRTVATFAFYYRVSRDPTALERRIAEVCVDLIALAVEREQALARLDDTHRLLSVALGSMSQGLCLFDAEDRLLLFNSRFREIYGLAEVTPGMHFREILAASLALGNYPNQTIKEVWRQRKTFIDGRNAGIVYQELAGDRIIAISHQSLADGGWVATYQDVTERRGYERRLAHMATHDLLTNLPNRALLEERMAAALQQDGGTLLYIDLDRFKAVNDTLGHAAGDELLRRLATRLATSLAPDDILARLSGDEFALFRPACRDTTQADDLARGSLALLQTALELDGHTVQVDASIGIALAEPGALTTRGMFRNADLALYRAKAEGRGRTRFYEPSMDERHRQRQSLELDLRHALGANQFELAFQPQFAFGSDRVVGAEALLRWRRGEHGYVSPAEFVPIAEECGLITAIGEWVLRTACREAADWPDDIRVAVNLSAVQLWDEALVGYVDELLAELSFLPDRLELEITESVLLSDSPAVATNLKRLHERGIRLALDDFGTGYSSMSCLHRFPFDNLKIDRSFIADMSSSPHALAIVRAAANLGRDLGMETTAEGVETTAQLDQVRALGCSTAQGYLIGRPQPALAIRTMLDLLNTETREGIGRITA